ncbi:MAG: hypothetical protein KDI13_07205 [Alphaproteobacteria bacterium]|nr:hypothetical protein [Alphaproteobacteria bacterium]
MNNDDNKNSEAALLRQKLRLDQTSSRQSIQKSFVSRITELMLPGILSVDEASEDIRELFKIYSMYNTAEVKELASQIKQKAKDYPDAGTVKLNASSIVYGLHTALGKYCICMLEVNRIMAQLKQDMEAAKERSHGEIENIQWSPDLPKQIAVAVRRRDALRITLKQLEDAERIVFLLDSVLRFMLLTLNGVLGEEKAKPVFDGYTAKLKAGKLKAAIDYLNEKAKIETSRFFVLKKKEKKQKWGFLVEIAELIGKLIQKCRKVVSSNDQHIFLRQSEVEAVQEDVAAQLQKNLDFIAKYELPEIRYRFDALGRQKKILSNIGSFEEILQMIETLETASFSPMPTMKDVKTFEEGLYKEALGFLEQDSIAIENILKLAQELSQGPDPEAVDEDEIAPD